MLPFIPGLLFLLLLQYWFSELRRESFRVSKRRNPVQAGQNIRLSKCRILDRDTGYRAIVPMCHCGVVNLGLTRKGRARVGTSKKEKLSSVARLGWNFCELSFWIIRNLVWKNHWPKIGRHWLFLNRLNSRKRISFFLTSRQINLPLPKSLKWLR